MTGEPQGGTRPPDAFVCPADRGSRRPAPPRAARVRNPKVGTRPRDAFARYLLLLLLVPIAAAASDSVTLFAFDDHSLPFKSNLKLTFETPAKHPANPVLRHGPPGSVDGLGLAFYGSVIKVGDKYRMWYRATSDRTAAAGNVVAGARLAYAESVDGINWTKPELGLVEFNGNRRNNLLGMPAQLDYRRVEPLSCFVLHEPDDPDPARRYKMAVYGRYYPTEAGRAAARMEEGNVPSSIYPFFSADGLTWTLAVPPPRGNAFDETEVPFPVRNNFEIGGLYKFDGIYYVVGQELSPDIFLPDGGITRRTMVAHWSGDFVRWSSDRALSFHRYGYRSVRESLQEAHVPASVWNRGNVLLGLYGLWHGAVIVPERRMDLGFLVSNDGIHFREPIPDQVFLPRGADGEWDERGLIQGQGFENIGDRTFIYYGSWDISQVRRRPPQIGLATLPRDRFAHLSTRDPVASQFTSMPVPNTGARVLHLNVDGLSGSAGLRVELIDRLGEPVVGYSGRDAAIVRQSGLRVPVTWPNRSRIECANAAYRLRITWEGTDAAGIRFYAAYLE